ncbi:MAG: DMT family transporter [Rhodobacterales bacterium]|nr:DMT family transporter [Rhodobacterales bacterium]
MTDRARHLKGLAITTLGVLVLTPDSLLVRLISADTWTLLFWRGLLASLAVILVLVALERRHAWAAVRAMGWAGVGVGMAYAGSTLLFVNSLRLGSVANTLVIISAAPLFGALGSWWVLKERVPPRTWVAIVIAMAAIAYLVSGSAEGVAVGGATLAGDLAALGTALCLSASIVLMRRMGGDNSLPAVALGAALFALAGAVSADTLVLPAADWPPMLLLGGVVIPIAFGLIMIGPRYIPAPEVGLIFLLETVLGPLWVWLVIGEQPSPRAFVAGGVLVATLVIHAALSLRALPRGV